MSDVPLLPEPHGPPRPPRVEPDLVLTFRPLPDDVPVNVRLKRLLKLALRCYRFRLLDLRERPEPEE